MLCEEQLTLAIAARMYELRELQGYEFSTTSEEQPKETVEIVNHFYIRNMHLDRDKNPCLSKFRLVCTKSTTNEYSYLEKSSNESSNDSSILSLENLQRFLEFKQKYQNDIEGDQKGNIEEQKRDGAETTQFLVELNRFENDEMLKGKVGAEFVTLMEDEYEALVQHLPNHKLIVNEQAKQSQ